MRFSQTSYKGIANNSAFLTALKSLECHNVNFRYSSLIRNKLKLIIHTLGVHNTLFSVLSPTAEQ